MSRTAFFVAVPILGLTLCASGCASLQQSSWVRQITGQPDPIKSSVKKDSDLSFLTSASDTPSTTLTASSNVLPLQTGNFWEMATQNMTSGSRGQETVVVTGPAANASGEKGIGVETRRDGKRFRYEIYRSDASGLYLLAAKDETSPVMSYNPPIPLVRYPAKIGDAYPWSGEISIDKQTYPATALGRYTEQSTVSTKAGSLRALRLDSMISLTRPDQDVRFPNSRWLALNVGFVRRGYIEKKASVFAEVTKFNTR